MKIYLLSSFILGSILLSGFASAQCNFSQNEFNNASEQNSKILYPELLSGNNDQSADSFLVYGSLQNINDAKFLKLSIKASAAAIKALGNLYNGESVQLELHNKEVIRLSISNAYRNLGHEEIGLSLFLGDAKIETLEANGVELLKLPWSKGEKTYEVDADSYFINNLPCIN